MSTDSVPLSEPRHEIVLQNPCSYKEAGARRLRPWIERMAKVTIEQASSLTVRFVSDREMRRLNAIFRHQDRPTDVLSFPADDGAPPEAGSLEEARHVGDVVVSVPTARRQAAPRGHGVERELQVLVLHGTLHCLGYDHEADDGAMEHLEDRLRRRLIDDE